MIAWERLIRYDKNRKTFVKEGTLNMKKLVLFGLVLVLLTCAVLFGSLVYIMNMVLPSGSAEEFAALKGWDDSVIYRDQENRYYYGGEYHAESYVGGLEEGSLLRKQLGGMQRIKNETEKYALFYVTEPSQQLRDQIQQEPEFEFMEVALAKCDYSLTQLGEALSALDAYLPTAPASVRDSVQVSLLLPRKNRIVIYVQNWSLFDQLCLAQAMGPLCPRLYLVEENLDETMPQMEFIHYDDWASGEGEEWWSSEYGGTKEPISEQTAYEAYSKMRQIRDDYFLNMELSVGTMNWRMAGLQVNDTYRYCGCMLITSQMKYYTGPPMADFIGVRPAEWTEEESYSYYESWEKTQEYLTKAIFREMEDFEYPIVVLHSY